jgi:putative CocE/NonD family hydrolase
VTNILIERDLAAPMRDGVVLRADVYRPAGKGSARPVLLERTPYDKRYYMASGMPLDPLRAVEHGYAVVIQDVRGRFASDGEFCSFVHEADDGYDTVEWAAAQPWSDGGVGMYGSSYMAATAWQAAVSRPPHLRTICPSQASSDYYEGRSYRGGVPELGSLLTTALLALGPGAVQRLDVGAEERRALSRRLRGLADNLVTTAATWPLTALLDELPEALMPYLRDWLEQRTDGDYWRAISLEHRYGDTELPVLHMTSWFDSFLDGTLRNYEGMVDAGHAGQRLVVGPWTHHVPMAALLGSARVGDLDCGLGAMLDFDALQLGWFDEQLRDAAPSREQSPVRIFVMGSNRWRSEDRWPPLGTCDESFYLGGGEARTRHGDGSLAPRPAVAGTHTFAYDPRGPVPTTGGAHVLIGTTHPAGSFDQRGVEDRGDVLVYTSPPLEDDLEVIGWISAELFVASSAPDTDFTVKLVDLYPDGRAMNVTDGIQRLSLRGDRTRITPYHPGDVCRLDVTLSATAHCFLRGHAVRIEVSSSNFPRFEPNLNTGGTALHHSETQVARQSVFHGAERASRVTLPVVR